MVPGARAVVAGAVPGAAYRPDTAVDLVAGRVAGCPVAWVDAAGLVAGRAAVVGRSQAAVVRPVVVDSRQAAVVARPVVVAWTAVACLGLAVDPSLDQGQPVQPAARTKQAGGAAPRGDRDQALVGGLAAGANQVRLGESKRRPGWIPRHLVHWPAQGPGPAQAGGWRHRAAGRPAADAGRRCGRQSRSGHLAPGCKFVSRETG